MEVSRYEVNRQIGVVLNRHDIDVTRLNYSFIGGTAYLSGSLLKNSESDLVPATIENLLKEIVGLLGIRDVQTDFQNWSINNAGGAWLIAKREERRSDIGNVSRWGGQTDASREVHIETSENISDVLKNVGGKPGPK